jgi:thiol-disulfide isomerase/thioredoxin
MKRTISSASVLAAILVATLVSACAPARPTEVASNLRAHTLQGVNGNAVNVAKLAKGRVTVIDLFATWCKNCETQRPKLQRISESYPKHQVQVVGIAVGDDWATLTNYLGHHKLAYPILLDPDFQLADALGETRIPRILIVEPTGRITYRSNEVDALTLRHIDESVAQARTAAQ